jgi:hypothetical protein
VRNYPNNPPTQILKKVKPEWIDCSSFALRTVDFSEKKVSLKMKQSQALMAYAYKPSYLGGKD